MKAIAKKSQVQDDRKFPASTSDSRRGRKHGEKWSNSGHSPKVGSTTFPCQVVYGTRAKRKPKTLPKFMASAAKIMDSYQLR